MAGIDPSVVADKEVHRILDRRQAIGKAIERANEGDIVIIAGKGHEDYQILGQEKVYFDDREVAREFLKARL
jgi:UDP-N-acetylmuramoyl-L-alanyl-D-glutamate--2,6-diaminopimelate ligase